MKRLKIEKLNINGEGLCFKDQKKWCVKNVLPFEEVEVEIKQEKDNFVNCELVKILSSFKSRIKEKCLYCNQCGGCDFMFVSAKDGLQIKKEVISDFFKEFFKKNIIANSSKNSLNYRNKVSFVVKNNKIGLQKRHSNEIVEIDNCLVAKKEINLVLKCAREYLNEVQNNEINHIVVRCLNGQVCITLVVKNTPKKLSILVSKLQHYFNENFGIYLNFNTDKKQILGNNWRHFYGLKYLKAQFNDIQFFVTPYSFMQINEDVMKDLYLRTQSEIEDGIVVEGYSGAGLLSCILAKKASKVFSIEINKTATSDANKTKLQNKIENLENINGDCNDILPKLIKKYPDATFVVDPPRSGLDKDIINTLLSVKPKKIIYISCNPYTLKQNFGLLKEHYEIEKFEIFDIFPQTFEIESLVVLKIK